MPQLYLSGNPKFVSHPATVDRTALPRIRHSLTSLESGTDGGDESGFCTRQQGLAGTRIPAIPVETDGLPQLSGRSRALLKRYFDEAEAFRLPIGHPTAAFTESQVYNLLRVLTDETLRMSYSTTKRMVLDAVRGTPIVALSKTDRFWSRVRAQTPARGHEEDSSMSEMDSDPNVRTGCESSDGMGESSFFGESDSATEMALISETFKQTPTLPQAFCQPCNILKRLTLVGLAVKTLLC